MAKKDTLYNVALAGLNQGLRMYYVYKLDTDFEVLETYNTSQVSAKSWICDCPAWKSPCKHMKMCQRVLDGEENTNKDSKSLFSLNQDKFIKHPMEVN